MIPRSPNSGCSMSSRAPAGPVSGADWSPHASRARANSATASSLYGPTTFWSPRAASIRRRGFASSANRRTIPSATTSSGRPGRSIWAEREGPIGSFCAILTAAEGRAMTETRKIAAILAADVVGFSRLAGADEDRTLARLRALRSDLIDPTIAVHNGRVVKRTGDGSIVEFRSVVDAVRCAIEVQNAMVERNSGLPPERRIEFRIGIHVGDVVEESDGDLMGDGVNIAARLEGIARPGAICLSEDAYRQVKSRLDRKVTDLGLTQLKNISEPMRVYSLEVGQPAEAKPTPSATAAIKREMPAPRKSVWPALAGALAVLPFLAAGGGYLLGGRLTKH